MRGSCIAWLGIAIVTCLLAAGCAKQTPDELRRETAHATSEVKQDTKAVAEGVRDGLRNDKPVDINAASRSELASLPGVTAERADKIIANRPYGSTGELVSRHVLTGDEYDHIKERVRVSKPSPSGE